MENNTVNANTQNGDNQYQDLETINDAAALKELVIKERSVRAELDEKNRQLFERAKKAEGFTKDEDGNWIKIVEKKSAKDIKTDKKSSKETESDEFTLDLGAKAYLKANGIQEFDFVLKHMDESGIRDVEKLIENGYFKQALATHREVRAVEDATPTSRRTTTGKDQKSTAEYWINKGEMPPETPENQLLRREIVNYKMEMERRRQKF